MRKSADWMTIADDRILEYIRENGSGRPKEMVDKGIRYTGSYLSQRAKKLVEHGLLNDLGNGVYTITERGEGYLDGEINTAEDAPDEIPESDEQSGPTASDENHV